MIFARYGDIFVLQVDRPRHFLVAAEVDDLVDKELLADLVEERLPRAVALQRERVLQRSSLISNGSPDEPFFSIFFPRGLFIVSGMR
jgi:hypothetical protein